MGRTRPSRSPESFDNRNTELLEACELKSGVRGGCGRERTEERVVDDESPHFKFYYDLIPKGKRRKNGVRQKTGTGSNPTVVIWGE
ncbi:hypothetical protein KM043_007005 [Ampulex compressa]|nr:hypothetical protein KM043_007005 [Ampulex compressa]